MKQGIHEQSDTLIYPIGTRFAQDERAWRYAKAVSAIRPSWGAITNMTFVEDATIAAAAAVGDKTITCTAVAAVDADHYAGGYAAIWTGATANRLVCYRIKSNTAALLGATFTVTLESPLVIALGADATVCLYQSPFAEVMDTTPTNEGYGACVGISPIEVTINYYFWLQTWGPCVAIPIEFFGATKDQHMAYFMGGGCSPATGREATANNPGFPIAGPALPYTGPSTDPHDMPELLINLMLFP